MIKAKHNILYIWFFRNYFRLLSFLNFRKFTIINPVMLSANQSVLLLQNHFSWWDGYWSYQLSRTIFKRKFHVMMLEEQLRKHLFLNRCGVFSIKKNHRDTLESLNYASEILQNPDNLLTIYPSGKMYSQHVQSINFQQGIERLAIAENQPQIIFAVFLIDYFGFARPEIRCYLKNYNGNRILSDMESSFHQFYQSCIDQQTE